MMKLSYRPEIDGLRGLAIFIIFLSHFPDSIVKSGGVNIFFVISGFLIAQIIEQKYKYSLIDFYKSRIKSLFPQLLIISTIIYLFFLFFGEFEYIERFYSSCKYAILGILNIYFIKNEVTYGQESFLNPFGPFWAFSVIIQFYITYGLIYKFILIRDAKFSLLSKVILITILSFLIYLITYAISPNSKFVNFYSLLTRYWQFFAGASLYYILLKHTISNKTKNILILVALVVFLGWQFSESFNTNFQIKTLLISSIGLLTIAASGSSHFINKALSTNYMIRFGKISYPFYLWHMAIVYFAYLYLYEVTLIHKTLITVVVIFLSLFTIKINTFLIRQKFINHALLFGIVLLTLIMQIFNRNIENYFKNFNYINEVNKIFTIKNSNIGETYTKLKNEKNEICLADEFRFDCVFNNNQKNKVVLLGTSHMATFSNKIVDELTKKNFSIQVLTSPKCPYLPNFFHKDCSIKPANSVRNYLLNTNPSIIIYNTRYQLILSGEYYTNHKGIKENPENNNIKLQNDDGLKVPNQLYNSLKELTDYGHKLILIYPTPEFGVDVPNYYKIHASKYNPEELRVPKAYFIDRAKESYMLLDNLKSANIERVYPSDFLCDESYCYSMINNKILYSDDDHLNQNGVNLIAPEIIKKVNQLSLQN